LGGIFVFVLLCCFFLVFICFSKQTSRQVEKEKRRVNYLLLGFFFGLLFVEEGENSENDNKSNSKERIKRGRKKSY